MILDYKKKIKDVLVKSLRRSDFPLDLKLLLVVFVLAGLGLLITSSASMSYLSGSDYSLQIPLKHLMNLLLCFLCSLLVLSIRIEAWFKCSFFLLLISFALLLGVLFFGVSVNGSKRWLPVGLFYFQVAELSKLCFIVYLASYISRRQLELVNHMKGFYKPVVLFCMMGVLLLCQPDLGSLVVLFSIAVAMLFLAGARLRDFLVLIFSGGLTIGMLSWFSPYRIKRIISFLDPWSDPFGDGYQLVQSLIAYGRGGFFGLGLGESIQKLNYLPEAHTDFILAILAEELGFVGVMVVLLMLLFVALKAILLGKRSILQKDIFSGFLAYGIGFLIFFQTFVNTGVSLGILPTKGLTLPFISYGGSSLIVTFISIMIVFRIDYEQYLLLNKE